MQAEAEGNSKKMRMPLHEDLDQAMLQWFQQQLMNHVSLSELHVKTKAEIFASQLGIIARVQRVGRMAGEV